MANTCAGTLLPLTGYGWQCLDASASSSMGVTGAIAGSVMVLISINVGVGVDSDASTDVLHNGVMNSSLGVAQNFTSDTILSVIMQTLVEMGYATPDVSEAAEVWALNMDTGAVSRYADYDFNSYGMVGGRYVAAKQDGLYVLDETTTTHYFLIDLGTLNFGTTTLKHLPNLYVGISAGGDVFLRVTAAGESYVYKARAVDAEMQTQRFDLGRGLRATHFDFELYGECEAELSSVEFTPIESHRRI